MQLVNNAFTLKAKLVNSSVLLRLHNKENGSFHYTVIVEMKRVSIRYAVPINFLITLHVLITVYVV